MQDVHLILMCEDALRLSDVVPAHIVEFVVVLREVAAGGSHQVEVNGLVHSLSLGVRVPVANDSEFIDDAGLEPGLFVHFANRGFLERLTEVHFALRQCDQAAGVSPDQDNLYPLEAITEDDTTG